jgi:glycosyltransferase involved in cell wall biosynthesis
MEPNTGQTGRESEAGSPAPRISVCVPTYNGAAHLRECLAGIRSQTLKDFEVIIVDDDSRDASADIASEFAREDPRFRVQRNPQRLGLVGNWGRCVALARGEWIKFAFQDDILAPACLEKLIEACARTRKPFGFCARNFIFDDGVGQSQRDWFENHARRLRKDYQDTAVISPGLAARIAAAEPAHNPVGEPTVTLIHKSLFQELGGFDDALIQLCDLEFWLRVLLNHGGAYVPGELAAFRIHAGAATAVNRSERAFRMGLDTLILEYRFAFGRHFEIMRRAAESGKSALALRVECARSAARAWRQARQDPVLRAEWQAVRARCPGLRALALAGAALEFPGRIKRACLQNSPANGGK